MSQHVTLDERTLRRIADETGARYFNVRDPDGLAAAMEEIDSLEKTRVERDLYSQYNELFPWFLTPGLVLIILGSVGNMLCTKRIV